jgi:hypothetical protein
MSYDCEEETGSGNVRRRFCDGQEGWTSTSSSSVGQTSEGDRSKRSRGQMGQEATLNGEGK